MPGPGRTRRTLSMAYIRTIDPEDAEGLLAELYGEDVRKHGRVPNYSRVWSLRPEVLSAWRKLLAAIRSNMDPRRYELVTILASAKLRCTY
jgi:alkylhydroperoxidase family enzyme